MLPSSEQIQVAAYHLWEERGCIHGSDREDWENARKQLLYHLNYQPVVEYVLSEPGSRVLGQRAIRHCRFCERSSNRTHFPSPAPVVPIVENSALLSAEICQECQSECREPLTGDLARFWQSLRCEESLPDDHAHRSASSDFSLGAYKSLVASALLMLPDREVPYFLDALEWVSNPDPDVDQCLFAATCCRAYLVPSEHAAPRAWLARRIDDDAPLPYMIAFVSSEGIVVQIHLPLCSRDDDSAEDGVTLLEWPARNRDMGNSRQSRFTSPPLGISRDLGRFHGRRNLVEC